MHDNELEYVGFWARVGATLLDSILLLAITMPPLIAIYGWEYLDPDRTGFFAGPADFVITWVFPAVAVILFWIRKQATPGKMAISARVVDAASGETMTVGQAIGRYFAYVISALPLCLGYIWIAFDPRKQAWHDKLAGTVVVRPMRDDKEPVHFTEA